MTSAYNDFKRVMELINLSRWRELRARLRAADANHVAIARGLFWVALFVFISKLAGGVKEMGIAWRYGVSQEVDVYLFIFNLVNWPVSVWFSVLAAVLVPVAADIRHRSPGELPRFRAELLGFALLAGSALAILAWLGLPVLLCSGLAGLSGVGQSVALQMVPVLVWLIPLGIMVGLFSSWMLAAGRHVNTLLEGVPALTLWLVLLAVPRGGIAPLVWGTLMGFVLHLASLAILLARSGEIEAPRLGFTSPKWPSFWSGYGVMLAAQALMSLSGIIDQFFAAHLGPGAVSVLGYANRILALILGLGATAVGRATLPVFSKANAKGHGELYRTARHWAWLLFFLGLAMVPLSWWLAPWGVRILFERGAFTAQDTQVVAEVLQYGLLQVPFYFSRMVLFSLSWSINAYRANVLVAFLAMLVKWSGNAFLVPVFGVKGIMMATGLMYLASLAFLGLYVARMQSIE